MLRSECGVAHAFGVFLKVVSLDADLFGQLRIGRLDGTKRGYQIFNLPLIQQRVLMDNHPALLLSLLVGKQFAGQFPEVLSGVIKIDDLNRAGEVLLGNIPDPFRSIADDDLLFGAVPTALAGFQIEAQPKLLRRFNRANVGSRAGVAEGKAFLIPSGLRKHASQLGLPGGAGCPSVLPARPSVSFFTTGTPVPSSWIYTTGIGFPITMVAPSAWRGGSPLALGGRCLPQSPPPCAPRPWWSPPDRRAVSFAGGHGQRGRPVPQWLACGALPERSPYLRCPVRRRPGTGRCGSASTGSRDAILSRRPLRSEPVWNVTPGRTPDVRKHKAGCAVRWPAPGIAGVCRWRRKRVPVWRSRGSQVWGYALACGGRRKREEADCFLSQAGLSSPLTRGVR